MAEIDLQCDDPNQAQVKLDGIVTILGTAGALGPESASIPEKRTKSKASLLNTLGASPQLQRSQFSKPLFLNHDLADCDCYHCSQKLFLGVVVSYFNLQGVCFHVKGDLDAAASYFEGTVDMVRCVQGKIPEIPDPGQRFQLLMELVTALLWQVECYGRDNYLSKCEELLEHQREVLGMIPSSKLRLMPVLLNRYYEQCLFVGRAEQFDLSGIIDGMKKTSLLLTPQPLKEVGNQQHLESDSNKATTPVAPSVVTPKPNARPKRTRAVPKTPAKKVI